MDLLAARVVGDATRLRNVHAEQVYSNGRRFAFDVDSARRCSGTGTDGGLNFRFVTTEDGRMLITTDSDELGRKLAGRWVETPWFVLPEYCQVGPLGVVLRTTDRNYGGRWSLTDVTRVGIEPVGGRPAVHFRKSGNGNTVDTWIAASGSVTRVLKQVVSDADHKVVVTTVLSRFDAAGPVQPVPSADLVVAAPREIVRSS